ncbi:MAG TPA: ribulose-phosphate 3-epimerase [Thermoleophilia bacterium]|nr:ribulose-phosphate 3-epimerase [Thermoleophilia bacterium]
MGIPADIFGKRLLAPSVLSADFSRLGEEVAAVLEAGVRLVHFDVMDGRFVPNLTIGPAIVAAVAPQVHRGGAYVDVHLMVEHPDAFLDEFVAAGADALSVHVETTPNLHRTLARIRALGAAAGVVLNPATPVCVLEEAVLSADYVLVMSVDPGFGGQAFIPESLDKLRRLRAVIPPRVALQVDGGVGRDNIARLVAAGADWLVAGSAVFGGGDATVQAGVLQSLVDQAPGFGSE